MRKLRHLIGLCAVALAVGPLLLTSAATADGITIGPVTIGPVTIGSGGGAGSSGSGTTYTTTGFNLSQSSYSVAENAGYAIITVIRGGNELPAAQVRYHTPPLAIESALPVIDYTPVKGVLDFSAGQTSASFAVPIVNLGLPGTPSLDFEVALFGANGTPLGLTTTAQVTIIDTDTQTISRIVGNPLALTGGSATAASSSPSTSLATNPLAGVQFFVDKEWGTAAVAAREYPAHRRQLDVIADEPVAMRFVASNTRKGGPGLAVARYIQRARSQEPGTIPEISTYDLNHSEKCVSGGGPGHGHYSDSPAQVAAYERWIHSLASGISDNRAVVYLEIDGLITTGCLGPTGLHRRIEELSYAVDQLSALPRTAVYVDAGASDALTVKETAKLLNEIGVSKIQGFFLNATHYQWTSAEIRYGDAISRLTGGAHFVVNTAVNGRGPLVPKDRVKEGNEVRCNPPGRGLGPKPTTDTGYKLVDAFAWIGDPGLSTGTCGDPKLNAPTGVFDLAYALSLIKNANFGSR